MSEPLPPVALIVFNRPDLTAAAMTRLARVRPEHLLIIADGPRDDAEALLCDATVAAVRAGITWPVHVEWSVSPENLGCSERVATGLDWVFERVDRAVILEDDIEVADAFFAFAGERLQQHRLDRRVGAISARNELVVYPGQDEVLHTRRCGIWGWATWADRWQDYRSRFESEYATLMERLPYAEAPLLSRLHAHFWGRQEWRTSGVWDIAWTLWLLTHDLRTVVPPVNMSANHGFRPDGTHTAVELDLRGEFPVLDRVPADCGTRLPTTDPDAAYDDLSTLLDLMMLYAEPRRWRVLADHATTAPHPDPAMDLMLEPWRRRDDARAALDHLAGHVASPHLDGLREAFA